MSAQVRCTWSLHSSAQCTAFFCSVLSLSYLIPIPKWKHKRANIQLTLHAPHAQCRTRLRHGVSLVAKTELRSRIYCVRDHLHSRNRNFVACRILCNEWGSLDVEVILWRMVHVVVVWRIVGMSSGCAERDRKWRSDAASQWVWTPFFCINVCRVAVI